MTGRGAQGRVHAPDVAGAGVESSRGASGLLRPSVASAVPNPAKDARLLGRLAREVRAGEATMGLRRDWVQREGGGLDIVTTITVTRPFVQREHDGLPAWAVAAGLDGHDLARDREMMRERDDFGGGR